MSTASTSAELKSLETRRNELQTKLRLLNTEINEKQLEAKQMKEKVQKLQKQIEDLKTVKPSDIIISEHSMLRYIERVLGINLTELQNKILNESERKTVSALGNCTYNKGDFKVKIKDGVVVTIMGEYDE